MQTFHGKRLRCFKSLSLSVVAGLVWIKLLLCGLEKRGNLLLVSRIFDIRGIPGGFHATVTPKTVCYCRLWEAYASYDVRAKAILS